MDWITKLELSKQLLLRRTNRKKLTDSFNEIPTFSGITPLPPVEAASYFQKLVPSLDNLNVRLFENQMRRQSMTLAAATEQTLIKKVQEAIQTGLESGGKEASKFDLNTILSEAGVTPKNPQYAGMVYRINAMDSYNAGLRAEYQAPDVKAFFPVWQYLGIEDGRQGSDH
ncbi:hypothetical protein KIH39_03485 [Telmatocola sphagniphila]|uniref:Uncharacterized protein n=1 Tax=Telmatocola sphagniphila TaxID=1123043 RepID=A0A8E6B8B8_9BACT|nr:hypothetical protein [Telmatocola sphagniphila]QVL32991.1 hypothetical protein KIH39_03485 [Telmatocola sphagniphila]